MGGGKYLQAPPQNVFFMHILTEKCKNVVFPVSTHQSTNTQTTYSIPQTSAPTSAPPQTAQSPSRNAQLGRPQPGASAVGSQSKPKKKPLKDRLPKGSSDPIAQANRFLLLPDDAGEVEMAEAAPRGNRSRLKLIFMNFMNENFKNPM